MDNIRLKAISLNITNVCTLRCELCSAGIPYYKEFKHVEFTNIKRDLDMFFKVVDYVDKFDIGGGRTIYTS